MDYQHRTEPFPHQRQEFELSRDARSRALFWEMGTGKTKPTIDTLAWLHLRGEITGALVLAPKAVAPNWANVELPKHLPDAVRDRTRVLLWRNDKVGTGWYQDELREAAAHDGLLVVCMSYEGIMQGRPGRAHPKRWPQGCHFAKELLTGRPCAMVLDESARIKDPSRKRTIRVVAAGRHAKYRRILTGTPVDNSPFDVYAQVHFLDPGFWAARGCRGFGAFKERFGCWAERRRADGRRYPELLGYRNLDELHDHVDSLGSRLLKDDVLDLPPRLYARRHFELAPEQRRLYRQIRDDFVAFLASGGAVTAPLAITRLLRLQQVTSGYCPADDDGELVDVGRNRRLDLLEDVLEDVPHQCIVWAKFRRDHELIAGRLRRMGRTFVQYLGKTGHEERERARDAFQAGDAQVFLSNPQCAGEGLTLTAARTVVYYNTTYRLGDRLQSEARAHRPGQEHPVQYVDLVAQDTVDEAVLDALAEKKNLADLIMGDPRREWL